MLALYKQMFSALNVKFHPMMQGRLERTRLYLALAIQRPLDEMPRLDLALRLYATVVAHASARDGGKLTREGLVRSYVELLEANAAMVRYLDRLTQAEVLQGHRIHQSATSFDPNDAVVIESGLAEHLGLSKIWTQGVAKAIFDGMRPGSGPSDSKPRAVEVLASILAAGETTLTADSPQLEKPANVEGEPEWHQRLERTAGWVFDAVYTRILEHLIQIVIDPEPYNPGGSENEPTVPERRQNMALVTGAMELSFGAALRDCSTLLIGWIAHPWSRVIYRDASQFNVAAVLEQHRKVFADYAALPAWPEMVGPPTTGDKLVDSLIVTLGWNVVVPDPTRIVTIGDRNLDPLAADRTSNVRPDKEIENAWYAAAAEIPSAVTESGKRLAALRDTGFAPSPLHHTLPWVDPSRFVNVSKTTGTTVRSFPLLARGDGAFAVLPSPLFYQRVGVDATSLLTRARALDLLRDANVSALIRIEGDLAATKVATGSMAEQAAPYEPITDWERALIPGASQLPRSLQTLLDLAQASPADWFARVRNLALNRPQHANLRHLAHIFRFIGMIGVVKMTPEEAAKVSEFVAAPEGRSEVDPDGQARLALGAVSTGDPSTSLPWDTMWYHGGAEAVAPYCQSSRVGLGWAKIGADTFELVLIPFDRVPLTASVLEMPQNLVRVPMHQERAALAGVYWCSTKAPDESEKAARVASAPRIAGWRLGSTNLSDIVLFPPAPKSGYGVEAASFWLRGASSAAMFANKNNAILTTFGEGFEREWPDAAFAPTDKWAPVYFNLRDSLTTTAAATETGAV